MTQIRSLAEAEQVLARYIPKVKELLGQDITLERMVPLMQAFGNPQKRLRIVHIAGTSGKTSTAYYMAALLHASGKKVGLTVSPHLDSVTERIQINTKPLSEAAFCSALSEFMNILEKTNLQPSYFEVMMAFAYWYFAKVQVDYAVIETGLGGLHDASNIADNADKICIITDIGYDHMHVLGNHILDIAAQKAGIIQPHNFAFMYQQDPEITEVFHQRAAQQHAALQVFDEAQEREDMMIPPEFEAMPPYQQHNWLLAYKTYEFVAERDDLRHPQWDELMQTLHIQVPGRMDIRSVHGKTIVMDGAHNGQKMQAFVESFQALYPGKQAAILLGMKEGKEYEDVLPLLKPICSRLIISSFSGMQDTPIAAINPNDLAKAAQADGFKNITVEPDIEKAYKVLMDAPDELLIITGSFYLLASLRPIILNKTL